MSETLINTTKRTPYLWIKRVLGIILPILVILGAIATVFIMGKFKPEPEEKDEEFRAIPVLTATAIQEDVTLSVSAQGEVQPRNQINIVPQISGKITYMSPKFIEGGRFNKGDLLIRIEPTEFELRVIQARANVAQAETSLMREKSEAYIARSDWDELNTGNPPSPLTLREPQVAEAAARLESTKAQLEEAKLQLHRTSLSAPFSGRVTRRNVNASEFVTTGARLGEIYATDIMDVRLPLTNNDLAQAGLKLGFIADKTNPGIPVQLSANVAGDDARWKGRIVRTDSNFDSETRVLFAYVEVKDPFGKGALSGIPLAPGLYVNAEIQGESLSDIVTIPRTGLRGKDNIYIAEDDGTLSIKTVNVVSSNRDKVIITDGLLPGTQVITSPIRGVSEGMKIDIVDQIKLSNDETQP